MKRKNRRQATGDYRLTGNEEGQMRTILISLLLLGGCNSPSVIEVAPERPLLTSTTDRLQLHVSELLPGAFGPEKLEKRD